MELGDMHRSKRCGRKPVSVRLRPAAPRRKSQCLAPPEAGLGYQIVRGFRGKKKFPIPLEAENKKFYAYHWLVRMDGNAERLLNDNEIGWPVF